MEIVQDIDIDVVALLNKNRRRAHVGRLQRELVPGEILLKLL